MPTVTRAQLLAVGAFAVFLLFLVAVFVTSKNTPPQPGVSAPTHRVGDAFKRVDRSLRCGTPVTGTTWTTQTHGQQIFQHCGIVASYHRMTTPAPAPPPPTPAKPTALPVATLAPPVALPTPTVGASDPAHLVLALINQHRAQYGIPPLQLNQAQSDNSLGHAKAMAETGTIWHQNPAYPQYSFPQNIVVPANTGGENVGYAPTAEEVDSMMMSEPHSPGCSGNHACNIIGAQYTSVGIGVYDSGGYQWVVEDFIG